MKSKSSPTSKTSNDVSNDAQSITTKSSNQSKGSLDTVDKQIENFDSEVNNTIDEVIVEEEQSVDSIGDDQSLNSDSLASETKSHLKFTALGDPKSKINFETLKCYLNAGNCVAAIFRKSVVTESPELYESFVANMKQQIHIQCFGPDYENTRSAFEDEISEEEDLKRKLFKRTVDEFEQNMHMKENKGNDENFYISDKELEEFGISKVFHDMLINSPSIM